MIEGNRQADEAAGERALEHRIPQGNRARIAQIEFRAVLVRRRLLRAHIDAVAADPRQQSERQKRHHRQPPAPKVVAQFSSAHVLDDSGQRCTICKGSASQKALVDWWRTP
eukprot:852064-Pyramimonas_sp.AAC.1